MAHVVAPLYIQKSRHLSLNYIKRQLSFHKIIYLVSPSSTDRPSGFTTATTSPATAWPPAPTAWTAKVSKVDLQLGRNVIGWLPEVVLWLCEVEPVATALVYV